MPGGPFDLTGKYIAHTYQRVMQFDSSSEGIFDGYGDTINNFRLTGSLNVYGDFYADNLLVSSSTIYASGSTKFGDSTDDIHQITGSLRVTGSVKLIGNEIITGSILISGSIVGATVKENIKTITSNYDVSIQDSVILANTTANFSASLYDSTNQDGKELTFKLIGNNTLTIQPFTGQTIDGNANLKIIDKWVSVNLLTSGSNWYII